MKINQWVQRGLLDIKNGGREEQMKRIGNFTKWLLVTILILMVTGGAVWAYTALTSTGDITVEEPLSFVGDSTFDVTLYPQESDTAQITVANASSVDMEVDLISSIDPDPGAKGMDVDIPAKVNVPATGQATIDIVITAGKSAEPGSYTVSIVIVR